MSRSFGKRVWLCLCVSCALHLALWLRGRSAAPDADTERPFKLPTQLEFGLVANAPGGGNATREPAPKPSVRKHTPKAPRVKPANDPAAFGRDMRAAHTADAAQDKPEKSSTGSDADALGVGLGEGLGPGSGYAPAGATIALNVDLARVRQTALVLETQALLDVIPEWQQLLTGSGVEPLQDLDRVFVASPTLERASVVISARHHLSRARLDAVVGQAAEAQGKHAHFGDRQGFEVASWFNAGPTERVIALTGERQFTITRASDLERVLQVAQALGRMRREQGFDAAEVAAEGGLLAMQSKEAVALWVEGVAKYVRGEAEGVPASLRLSIYHVDQFNTELRVRGQYSSAAAAAAALTAMNALRTQLSDHPRVVYLGLKSALDRAQIEQAGSALQLNVRLTLHQTRYLLRFVTRALRPRSP